MINTKRIKSVAKDWELTHLDIFHLIDFYGRDGFPAIISIGKCHYIKSYTIKKRFVSTYDQRIKNSEESLKLRARYGKMDQKFLKIDDWFKN